MSKVSAMLLGTMILDLLIEKENMLSTCTLVINLKSSVIVYQSALDHRTPKKDCNSRGLEFPKVTSPADDVDYTLFWVSNLISEHI